MQYPLPIARLIDSFMKLPGIGEKTATRLAFYAMDMPKEDVDEFAQALVDVKEKLRQCSVCGNITEQDPCAICSNPVRDRSTIMVVEEAKDVMAFENMGEYDGLYHVLHGVLSPMDGIGPEQINIKGLLERIQKGGVEEVIMATNPTVEGEATAMYVARLVKPLGVRVTRLAYGIPVGGTLEYADEVTLYRALAGRSEL